jgi:hypothetical protein
MTGSVASTLAEPLLHEPATKAPGPVQTRALGREASGGGDVLRGVPQVYAGAGDGRGW